MHRAPFKSLIAIVCVLSSELLAMSYIVSTNGDSAVDPTTLRYAITQSNSGGTGNTITINSGLTSIMLGSSLPDITNNVTIIGPSPPQEIDGGMTYRAFSVPQPQFGPPITVNISNLSIVNSSITGGGGGAGLGGGGGGGGGIGGGLYVADPNIVSVTNVAFSGNMATGGNGGTSGFTQGGGGGGGGVNGGGGSSAATGGGGGGGFYGTGGDTAASEYGSGGGGFPREESVRIRRKEEKGEVLHLVPIRQEEHLC